MGNLDVVSWFENGKDYQTGVSIYEKIGKNKLLLRNFKRADTNQNRNKLAYELGKFLPVVVIPKKNIVVDLTVDEPKINYEAVIDNQAKLIENKQLYLIKSLPEEMLQILFKANLKWRENCILKVKLNSLPDDAESEALAIQMQISENWKENALCWKQIDYYLEHKQLPKEPKSGFESLTPAELVKRQQYHFQNISKLKKRIEANRTELIDVTDVGKKAKLSRKLASQESDLLAKEKELEIITNLVNGK